MKPWTAARSSAAAAGSALGGCAGRAPGSGTLPPARGLPPRHRLIPVDASFDRIVRTVVGLRPYRPSGFVVRAEPMGGKLVVHNYGHGGGGISLSWGSSHLAVEEVLASEHREVAVVGAGVMGLTTARLLQRAGRRVTIYARDLPPSTTSNVAGGQWTPFSVFDPDAVTPTFRARFDRAARLAHRHFQDFLGRGYGVSFADNWYLSDAPVRLGSLITELPDLFHDVEEAVPFEEHPFPSRHAARVTTMMVEPGAFLAATERDVRRAGGVVVVRAFRDAADLLSVPERVIVNCTGLGARELFGDEELVPVKGQLTVLVPQAEVDYLVLRGGAYMFPRSDGILLGGTFERGEWSLEPDADALRRIVADHVGFFDAMGARLRGA
ncbi:MAG: FAD-binding oxidoreductase [Gemmatimonadetes bacterium]|nr:FAD-binding oxidoreductase [Gemmatimonadota bacterium]